MFRYTDPTLMGDENEVFFVRVWKPLPNRNLKTVRLTTIRNGSKRTISVSGRLKLLQIVS